MKSTNRAVFYTLVALLAALGVKYVAPVAFAQEVTLEDRINAYQQGAAPAGPTKKELKAQVGSLTAKVEKLKARLKACQNPPTDEAP
jgi:phage shock protein A